MSQFASSIYRWPWRWQSCLLVKCWKDYLHHQYGNSPTNHWYLQSELKTAHGNNHRMREVHAADRRQLESQLAALWHELERFRSTAVTMAMASHPSAAQFGSQMFQPPLPLPPMQVQ